MKIKDAKNIKLSIIVWGCILLIPLYSGCQNQKTETSFVAERINSESTRIRNIQNYGMLAENNETIFFPIYDMSENGMKTNLYSTNKQEKKST